MVVFAVDEPDLPLAAESRKVFAEVVAFLEEDAQMLSVNSPNAQHGVDAEERIQFENGVPRDVSEHRDHTVLNEVLRELFEAEKPHQESRVAPVA